MIELVLDWIRFYRTRIASGQMELKNQDDIGKLHITMVNPWSMKKVDFTM